MDKRFISYLAILIYLMPIMVIPIWANLVTYVKSYYYYTHQFTIADIQVVVVIFAIATNVSFYCLQLVTQYYNNKRSIFLLMMICSFSYYMIPYCSNLFGFYLLFAILTVSQRTALNILNYVSVELFKEKKSFVIGINLASTSVAAIIWNMLLNYIINPDNVQVNEMGNLPEHVAYNLSRYTNKLAFFTFVCGLLGHFLIDNALGFELQDRYTSSILSSVFKKSNSAKTATFRIRDTSDIELQESMLDDKYFPSFNNKSNKVMGSFDVERGSKDELDEKFKSYNFVPSKTENIEPFILTTPVNEEKTDNEREDKEMMDSIYSFSDSKISYKLTEATIIRNYVLTKIFMIIWLGSFCRNVFNIYIKNNFKTISLYFINDDKFINNVSSATMVIMLASQLFTGLFIDKYGPYAVTMSVFFLNLVIIIIYNADPSSKAFFIVAIIFNRTINGINVILNNSMLYNLYSKPVATKLLKYFFINSVLSSIVTVIIDATLVSQADYTFVWLFYIVVTLLGSILLISEKNALN